MDRENKPRCNSSSSCGPPTSQPLPCGAFRSAYTLEGISLSGYITAMTWDVETSDEFTAWYNGLDDDETDSVDAAIELLEKYGPMLGRPHADVVHQSSFR